MNGKNGRTKRKSDEGGETRPRDQKGVRKKRKSGESEKSSLAKGAEESRNARSEVGGRGKAIKDEKEALKAEEKRQKLRAKEMAKVILPFVSYVYGETDIIQAAKEAERSYQKKLQEVNKVHSVAVIKS